MDKIKFQTNISVEVALKFSEGKLCESQFGDPQYMFTTTDDRVFFVAEKVAQKIHGLRLQPREAFDITKAEVDWGNGRKGIEWQVAKVGAPPEEAAQWAAIGQQPNGTFVVPIQPGAGAVTPAPAATPIKAQPTISTGNGSKPNGNGNGNGAVPLKIPLNVAVADAVRIVVEALKASGEQWSDASRQGLVSTVIIAAQHEGWIAPWQREASRAA
jgi:hypothetical protein